MVNWDEVALSAEGQKKIPEDVEKTISAIESVANTYIKLYTGPGGEEDAGMHVILALVCRLRYELV